MSEGARFVAGMIASALMFPALVIVMNIPDYVPSTKLGTIAHRSIDVVSARHAMARTLNEVRSGRRRHPYRHIRADTVGVTVRRFRSWQNDEGFGAITTVDCTASPRCTVAARALLSYKMTNGQLIARR